MPNTNEGEPKQAAAAKCDQRPVWSFLSRPSSYPESTSSVERVETHISVVFLTSDRVYKTKKSVSFPFLDYSSLEMRKKACLDEVELNRRLAPDVYLGVVPIVRGDDGEPAFGPGLDDPRAARSETPKIDGEVLEYCVVMTRLPDELMMHRLIEREELTPERIERVIGSLVDFQSRANRGERIDELATADVIEANVRENFETLAGADHAVPEDVFARARASQRHYLTFERDVFKKRIAEGKICEGHGDLRPEHVCCLEQPVVFDCVEFSLEIRASDMLQEIAFLAMECDFTGARAVSEQLLGEYRKRSGDDAPTSLFRFYQAYCATVRGKVELLRGEQATGSEPEAARRRHADRARRYLTLASFYALDFYRPQVVVVMGASGTGKSTISNRLGDTLGATVLSTDAVRREMFGASEAESTAEYGAGNYTPERVDAVYEEVLARGKARLDNSITVIFDGTFRSAPRRAQIRAFAQNLGVDVIVLRCRCKADVAQARIAKRVARGDGLSEALPEHHGRQLKEFDAHDEAEWTSVWNVETGGSIPRSVSAALRMLRDAVHLHGRER